MSNLNQILGYQKFMTLLEIEKADGSKLVLEVQAHIGENMVRTIAMDSSDGLSRGAKVVATDNPIKMPIGKEINGRLFNVIGDSIDGIGDLPKSGENGLPIHREFQNLRNYLPPLRFYLLE